MHCFIWLPLASRGKGSCYWRLPLSWLPDLFHVGPSPAVGRKGCLASPRTIGENAQHRKRRRPHR